MKRLVCLLVGHVRSDLFEHGIACYPNPAAPERAMAVMEHCGRCGEAWIRPAVDGEISKPTPQHQTIKEAMAEVLDVRITALIDTAELIAAYRMEKKKNPGQIPGQTDTPAGA